uniref:Reverse transcriptase domain-containing protein n=1 Tax=Salarias fasciatus TaxID=181472 RepID=A0A672FS48_SALFA
MDSQYGFRSNRSTAMALMDLAEEIASAIDSKKYAIGVFIDLKKTFDTIDHDIVLRQMEQYGIRGIVLDWLRNYIKNRQQFVQLKDFKSPELNITYGVPQGSVLGPKLFIMYINDIGKVSDILSPVVFADDTNIFCTGDDLQQMMDIVSQELSKLKSWFNRNKLSLNSEKTKFMLFGNQKNNIKVKLMIDNVLVERVYDNKFLGVILDHKLCWKNHTTYISSKLARNVGIMGRVKHMLNERALLLLYCSLVLPYLMYCVAVWGNTYKSTLQKICTLQKKKAIRIVHKVSYNDHTNQLFLKSDMLKFMDLVKLQTVQIAYKAEHNLLPGNLNKWFMEREGGYELGGGV